MRTPAPPNPVLREIKAVLPLARSSCAAMMAVSFVPVPVQADNTTADGKPANNKKAKVRIFIFFLHRVLLARPYRFFSVRTCNAKLHYPAAEKLGQILLAQRVFQNQEFAATHISIRAGRTTRARLSTMAPISPDRIDPLSTPIRTAFWLVTSPKASEPIKSDMVNPIPARQAAP